MFLKKINLLREKNLLRNINDRESPQGPRIMLNGHIYINFASNDYLGLTHHPAVISRAKEAIDTFGFGSGASRLLGGGSLLHRMLEERISAFKKTESALVFNSGHAANTGIIPALADTETAIFSDELNHASIIEGCRLSRASTSIYRHKDIHHLDGLLRKSSAEKKMVVTDTVFSMDGDIAPLEELLAACSMHGAILYLDEAHATGVLGRGRGALAEIGRAPEPWILQMGTFSKAFGSFGAFLAAQTEITTWAMNNARSFMYSTALPSCVMAASLAALDLIEKEPSLIERLLKNREKTANGIRALGYDIMGSQTPIIPVRTGGIENTMRISGRLFEKGIYAPAIRPPTVKESRVRITVTAAHTDNDIEQLLDALKKS